MPMSEGAPVTGYRTRLVRITLGNERLVEWIGSFHEASSNFVSIGRARSTASIRRLFFYKAFTILRMAPVMPRWITGPTSCESRKVPLSLSTSSLSSSLSNHQPFHPLPLLHIPPLFSKHLDPILSSLDFHGMDG